MTDILLIIFTITLFYVAIANRLMTYVRVLMVQGFLICGIAILSLHEMNVLNLVTILLETLVVKALAMPIYIRRAILKNKITRETEPSVPTYVSLIITTAIVTCTFLVARCVATETLNMTYFVVALSTIFCGLYFVASRRKVITHVICYVIVENGAFILSLSIGNELPFMVNLGVLLDVLVSVFLLAIFINKVGDVTGDGDITHLNKLKD
jgi:hydrogenase-4 component E